MKSKFPMTGTSELLAWINPFIPDDFINERWNVRPARGPRPYFSAAQLWRTHLLTVLTPAHSINQVLALLTEQRAWRSFARLSHRERIPDVRMLHQFRVRLGVGGLRQINDQLREPLVEQAASWPHAVALIDATDLEAACDGFKKKTARLIRRIAQPWDSAHSRLARAAGMSAIKNTHYDCGGAHTKSRSCWCRWSVGSRPAMFSRALY
jgi:hypothetical protein